ncbi:DMT family transporter [Tissierella sp.]|uniref:DMT family transporter n=1 Tax=Tissierella sp. TaxID=41274 RepID=UPI00285AA0FC|nr:DMT family transporter [Tissierella sp.]MDR7856511.1 DMT family transporter [Tissierella sp.]
MTEIHGISNRYKGIIAALIASFLWSTGGILIKLVQWNPVAIAGSRSFVAALVLLAYIRKPKITKSKPQVLGAIAYALTVILYVMANKLTTSANAILLQYTAPIFVAVLGIWILKEKIHSYDIYAILAVILGMAMFFINDVSSGNMLGNILAILSGLTLAFVTISLRMQKDGSAIETTLLGNVLTFAIAIPFILKGLPDIRSLFFIVIMGIFQLGISYIFYVYASKQLGALEAILLTVIEPLLNPVWVYIFSGEKPGIYAVIGGVIVITAVILRSIYISKKNGIEEVH